MQRSGHKPFLVQHTTAARFGQIHNPNELLEPAPVPIQTSNPTQLQNKLCLLQRHRVPVFKRAQAKENPQERHPKADHFMHKPHRSAHAVLNASNRSPIRLFSRERLEDTRFVATRLHFAN